MLESEIEKELVRRVRAAGGKAFKWVSPGNAGVPDRIVIMPGGRIWFVELKADTGRLSPAQQRQINHLNRLGVRTFILKGQKGLETFTEMIGGEA